MIKLFNKYVECKILSLISQRKDGKLNKKNVCAVSNEIYCLHEYTQCHGAAMLSV